MNSSFLTSDTNKEKIFLCRKIKRINNQKSPIFCIDKIKKIGKETEQFDYTLDSTTEIENKKDKIPSIIEIEIPSFFNDVIIKKKSKSSTKIKKIFRSVYTI